MPIERWVIWFAAICTLGIYTVLYRENPIFRFFEHVLVGLSLGYGILVTWTDALLPWWWQPFAGTATAHGQWGYIFVPLAGAMFYFIFTPRLAWIARLIIGAFFGLGAGAALKGFFPQYAPQVTSSFKPLLTHQAPYVIINHWVFLITLVAVMSYFFFSVTRQVRSLAASAGLGRWLLMIAFGAIFGSTVMGRLSLFLARVQFLLFDWLRIARP